MINGWTEADYNLGALFSKWYVCENDLIGGYELRTQPGPSSLGRGIAVADVVTVEVAQHIVELHNKGLQWVHDSSSIPTGS